jgi:hypothetical protein
MFDIEVGGVTKSVKWEFGKAPPDELSTIAVFDCHCARVYLTAEQDIAYLPYGLDVVENLANKVLPELSHRLESEIAGISVDAQPFAHLLGETEVGRLVATLSEKSTPGMIKGLATLTELEATLSAELDRWADERRPRMLRERPPGYFAAVALHCRMRPSRFRLLPSSGACAIAFCANAIACLLFPDIA